MSTQQRMTKAQAQQVRQAARRDAQAREQRRGRIALGATIAAAVAILGTVGVLAFGSASSQGTAAPGQSADKAAFVLPGLLAPSEQVSLAAHRGTPVVVNFFASWCVYCNEELPGFVQVAKATTGKVDFIGVDSGDPGDGVAMARRFDLAGAGFDLAKDIGAEPASDLWASYGSQGLPVTAFYDATGKLVDFSGGMLTQSELEARIAKNFAVTADAADAAALGAPVIPLIPQGAYELLARNQGDPGFVAVDLRSAAAHAAGHLPGAISAPYAADFSRTAALDRSSSYFLYDQDGSTAATAAQELHDAGFKHVYYVEGGMAAWLRNQLPTQP